VIRRCTRRRRVTREQFQNHLGVGSVPTPRIAQTGNRRQVVQTFPRLRRRDVNHGAQLRTAPSVT